MLELNPLIKKFRIGRKGDIEICFSFGGLRDCYLECLVRHNVDITKQIGTRNNFVRCSGSLSRLHKEFNSSLLYHKFCYTHVCCMNTLPHFWNAVLACMIVPMSYHISITVQRIWQSQEKSMFRKMSQAEGYCIIQTSMCLNQTQHPMHQCINVYPKFSAIAFLL